MRPLLDDQGKAVNKLQKFKVGALFMRPGTGKTQTTVNLINTSTADYVLWVCPYRTIDNLKNEIIECGGLKCDVVGIESIQSSDRIYLEYRSKCEKAKKAFVVIDESLKIKNMDALRTKRMMEISKLSEFRLILNGTPLSKNLIDLWSQMEFLSPKILGMNHNQFKDTFCEYIKVSYRDGYRNYTKEFIKKYHNIDYLYSLIEHYIFESELSLSIGKTHIDLKYNLTDHEKEGYNFMKEKYLDNEALMAKNNNVFLELTQKMQHDYSLSPEKFKIVDSIIKDNQKVLIYAKYINTQEELKKRYPNTRIMSYQKHSYGLNLQEYNTIIFWDKTWDYALREQAEHRIFRTGQKTDVTYYDLTGDVNLESLINLSIDKKETLLNIFKEYNEKGNI